MPKTRAAMPTKTSAARHPGATSKAVTGCLFRAERSPITLRSGLAGLLPAGERLNNKTNPAYQPIPLTINGPSRVATINGKRFQAAIKTASFGLRGFRSGIERPRAKRN